MNSSANKKKLTTTLDEAYQFYKDGYMEGLNDALRGLRLKLLPHQYLNTEKMMSVWQLGLEQGFYTSLKTSDEEEIRKCFEKDLARIEEILKL